MVEVHLYGGLRRVAEMTSATSDSIVNVSHEAGDTVLSIVQRIGIETDELGSNLFRNGRYATLETRVADGDRLGFFPTDMQLLYKWYFAPHSGAAVPKPGEEAPDSDSSQGESNAERPA